MAPEWNDNLFPVLQAGVEIDILFDAVSSTEVTYSIEGELPEGVLFDTATGQFSGTPSGNSEYSFTIWAENEFGRTSFEIANHVRSVDPYLIDGNPIELNPGEVSVYEDDTSIDSSSRTTLNHEAGGEDLLLETESGNLRLTGTCNEQTRCVITQDDNGNEILSLFDQGTIDVSGTGFMPGTTVFVYANSTPRLLGSVRVDRDGTYLASFRLSGLNAGNHTVQARGVGNNGSERAENVGIVVLSGESDPGVVPVISDDLARTGNNFEQMLLAATLLASMGIALRIMSPRRRLK
jgi:dipeptidyl aminopeptidase/acylaminoacyl peptidase